MVIHLWILVQLNRWTRGNRSVRYESNRNSEMGQESWRTEVSLNATMLWIRSHGQAHTSSEVIGVSIEYDRPQLWPPRNEANEAWIWMYCGRWLGKVDLTAQVHYQKFKTERWSSSSTILFNFRGLAFLFISFRMCCTCVWSTKMALIKQT
jgi:hypothetical protein